MYEDIQAFYGDCRSTRDLIEIRNAAQTALLVVYAAGLNPVSRGCHWVSDEVCTVRADPPLPLMRLTLLQSKLHGATVTGADLNYEGSIALDPDLRRLARLREYERVEIYNCHNGARLATSVIASNRDGEVVLNGAAARLVQPGDRVLIAAYAEFTPTEARRHRPAIILLDP